MQFFILSMYWREGGPMTIIMRGQSVVKYWDASTRNICTKAKHPQIGKSLWKGAFDLGLQTLLHSLTSCFQSLDCTIQGEDILWEKHMKNMAKVWNCPDITIVWKCLRLKTVTKCPDPSENVNASDWWGGESVDHLYSWHQIYCHWWPRILRIINKSCRWTKRIVSVYE